MSTAAHPDLLQFVAGIRTRLWLSRCVGQVERALWWSAGLVLAGTVAALLGAGLDWRHGLLVALAPPALAIGRTLIFRRPSLEAAASAADSSLDFGELLISAVEQARLPREKRAGTGRLVQVRAERRVMTVSGDVAKALPVRFGSRALIPLAIGLAGLFLHISAEGAARFSFWAPTTPVAPSPATPGVAGPSASILLGAQRALTRPVAKRGAQSRQTIGTGIGRSGKAGLAAGRADARNGRQPGDRAARRGAAAGSAGTSGRPSGSVIEKSGAAPDGTTAGRRAGGDAAGKAAAPDAPPAEGTDEISGDHPVRYIDIEGRPTDTVGLGSIPLAPVRRGGNHDIMDAASGYAPSVPARIVQQTGFPPALARVVADYFALLESEK